MFTSNALSESKTNVFQLALLEHNVKAPRHNKVCERHKHCNEATRKPERGERRRGEALEGSQK